MNKEAPRPLTEVFHDWVKITINEKGVEIPHGLILDAEGKLTVCALALDPDAAYTFMLTQWVMQSPREMIFALDRFAKPGQGTTLGDLLAGWHLVRNEDNAPAIDRRPFTIEYQHEPRSVKAIDWDNAFWNAALSRELDNSVRVIMTEARQARPGAAK